MARFSSPCQTACRGRSVSTQWRQPLRLGAVALMVTAATTQSGVLAFAVARFPNCPAQRRPAALVRGGGPRWAAARAALRQTSGPTTAQVHASPESGRVSIVERVDELEALIADGSDILVKLTFPWCRPCRYFANKYQRLASIYKSTHFVKVSANQDEAMKRYAQDLQIERTPMFAAYSGGRLVATWAGSNAEQFVRSIEQALPTAQGQFIKATLAAGRR